MSINNNISYVRPHAHSYRATPAFPNFDYITSNNERKWSQGQQAQMATGSGFNDSLNRCRSRGNNINGNIILADALIDNGK
jgi:hypothetical protein